MTFFEMPACRARLAMMRSMVRGVRCPVLLSPAKRAGDISFRFSR